MSSMSVRKTRQVETTMVAEYLLKNYSAFPYMMKVPLGPLPLEVLKSEGTARTIKLARPFRPEIDAIVILPRHLLLIEASVWNVMEGVSKLPFYKILVPITPELQKHFPRELIMQVVVGWKNNNLELMAHENNIAVKVFCPPWLQEVRESMNKYWTKEYQEARQKKLEMQRYFGVE